MNVLVSGVAGDIGFGIGRILREWGYFTKLYGIDIHNEHPGNFVFDECWVAPRASEPHYLNWLSQHIEKNAVKVFIPSSEAEIEALAATNAQTVGGAQVLMNHAFMIEKSLDKWECLRYLHSCGIPVPENGLVGQDHPISFPVIVKPRKGQGSKGVMLVSNSQEFKAAPLNSVWQEFLSPADQEYTCAVYASATIEMRVLQIRRKLEGGLTASGVVTNDPNIDAYVRSIASVLELDGAINIQLRLTAHGPLLFEINPRLSSTLVFRDKMNFSDLRWWLADTVTIDKFEFSRQYDAPAVGTCFYRGSQEYISTNGC